MDEAQGREKRIIGLGEYYRLMDRLVEKIRNSGIPFTYVGAVARGGFGPGERVSRMLNLPIVIVGAENWPTGKKHDHIRFSRHCVYLAERPHGPMIIVDDLPQTGETLQETVRYFHRKYQIGLHEMFTGVLLLKTSATKKPDFIADETPIDENIWVVFPMENPEIVI